MHLLVVYVPFLQSAFHTVPLSLLDWSIATAVAATLLVVMEFAKLVIRLRSRSLPAPGARADSAMALRQT
jgi:Ca2+-transporting ATPase